MWMKRDIIVKIIFIVFLICILFLFIVFHPKKNVLKNSFFPKELHTIIVKGDSDCKKKTEEALSLLEKKAFEDYTTVRKYIGIIDCVEKGSGMFAYETPPRYQVGKKTYYYSDALWYAGTIVHDACHSKLYNDYRTQHPFTSVPPNVWMGKNAEEKCLDIQYEASKKIGADEETLSTIKNAINTNYWDIPLSDRQW